MRALAGILLWLVFAAAAPAQPVTVTRQVSPGGIAYLHAAMPGQRYQTMQLGWRDAARLADPAEAFIPLLAPEALAEGPAGVGRAAFSETLEDLRAGFSVSVADEALRLSFHAFADDFSVTAGHIAALLAAPAFSARLFERLRRDGRLAALHQAQSAESLAHALLLRRLLPGHPRLAVLLRQPALYDEAEVERLRRWFGARVGRDNLVLATAGPLVPATLGPLVDRLAAAMPETAQAAPPAPSPRPVHPATLVAVQPGMQAQVFAGGLVPGLDPGRRARADLAVSVLWSGFSSRLFMALRERLGAAYSATGQLIRIGGEDHVFVIRTAVDPALAAAARAALAAEYARWWREGLTQEELDGARGRAAMWRRENLRAPASLAAALLTGALAGEGDNPVARAEARLESATLDEVNAVIRAHFPPEIPVHVAVVPDGAAPADACLVTDGSTCD